MTGWVGGTEDKAQKGVEMAATSATESRTPPKLGGMAQHGTP